MIPGYFGYLFSNKVTRAANGWPWAIAAIGLLVLTILFGTGPEGSGVKVNLFGFQPSEIVKFFLLLFLAGFFTTNEKFISEYTRWQKRWSFFSFALYRNRRIHLSYSWYWVTLDRPWFYVLHSSFFFLFQEAILYSPSATAVAYVLLIWLLQNIWVATLIVACF